jgi:hypothetical protein
MEETRVAGNQNTAVVSLEQVEGEGTNMRLNIDDGWSNVVFIEQVQHVVPNQPRQQEEARNQECSRHCRRVKGHRINHNLQSSSSVWAPLPHE